MVAAAGLVDAHVTVLVKVWVLLSAYVPTAVNCSVLPERTEEFAGVTAMETSAEVTVSGAD